MIVVGGFNTAIDRLLDLPTLQAGAVNRAERARALPGGKGLHVALTIAALGEPVTLVGLSDEQHGRWLAAHLDERGVRFQGVSASRIRTCVAMREASGRITEVLEPSPELNADGQAQLVSRLLEAAAGASLVVLTGSLPRAMPANTYAQLISTLSGAGVRCFLDASGEPLKLACAVSPALLKPNRDEIEELLGVSIGDVGAALAGLRMFRGRGLRRVVLSLGSDGALASWDDRIARVRGPDVKARNPVGSGDCLMGGLAVGVARELSVDETLRLGVACGIANALGDDSGVVACGEVERLRPQVSVEWIE